MNPAASLVCVLLIPLASAGLALIHQGLGRSRSAAHSMFSSLCALSVTAIVFVVLGAAWAGHPGGLAHLVQFSGRSWNLLGAEPLLGANLRPGVAKQDGVLLLFVLQMFAVGVASLIPISAGTDRWRLVSVCASSAVLAGLLYPIFAHAVWGLGVLAQLNSLFGLPPFVDGGAGTVQTIGGLSALSIAWVLGPRQGKYSGEVATAIPGHNIVLVLFGCLLALAGWIGLSGAIVSLVYGGTEDQLAWIALNTMLSAAGGFLAAVLITRWRYRKPDASLSANGWVAGLVAGSAGCGRISPLATIFVGLIAGLLVTLLVEVMELKLFIDDPGGSVSVHAGAGLWGLLAYGIFAPATGPRMELILAQLIGIATLLGLMLPLIYGSHLLLDRVLRSRVDDDGDWQGMDIRELGAGAYPEFVVHSDDFVPR